MNGCSYFPIIKTTDSEMTGYANLSSDVKKNILPIFELTRSRPVKAAPSGDIHKRMKQLSEYCEGNPFILDLTGHEELLNEQIQALGDDTNGFQEWRSFLGLYKNLNIIPMIHLYPDDVRTCIDFLEKSKASYDYFAFRVSNEVNPEELSEYLASIASVIDIGNKLILIVDVDYVKEQNFLSKAAEAVELARVGVTHSVCKIVINSSSFPLSVVSRNGGEDDEGRFEMLEVEVYRQVRSSVDSGVSICYGDYAGIHPIKQTIKGGAWVPRVDFVKPFMYVYKRYRRDDGGYIRAAKEMVEWNEYDADVECWGVDQIRLASEGKPFGKSPSFWIAVRLNIHITVMSNFISKI